MQQLSSVCAMTSSMARKRSGRSNSRSTRSGRRLVSLRHSPSLALAATGFSFFILAHPHSAAAQSSSPPKPSSSPSPVPPPPAPTTGELINGFAACMSSGEVNTPYCPHNAKNVESPIAGARGTLTGRFRFSPRNYFYVVVQSGDSPIVPFTMRGPTFAIIEALKTSASSTTTSTVSVRIPDAASVTQNPPPAGTSAAPATVPPSSLSLSTIAIICGIAGAAIIAILGLIVLARRRRAQANRKQAARASVLATLPGNGSGKGESGSLAGTSDGGSGVSGAGDPAAAAPAASYNMLRRAGSMTKPPRVGPTPDEANGNLHTYVPAGGESPALMAASAPMTPIPGSAPLTASAAAASSPGRLAATPVAGAISSTEAILIANSFKLALKKSIDDDDDEDISTMINSLGMRPIPDAGQATPGSGFMSPQQPAAAVLLDTPVPQTVTSPPGLVPRSVYPAASTASTTPGDGAAATDAASLKSASPIPPAPASLVSSHAHSTSPHISSPLALGHTGRQLSHDDQHSLLTGSMPRSLDSTSLPRSLSETTSAGHMTVERVSLDHRDRESTLLGRTPVKHIGSPYTAVVVVDPQDEEQNASGAPVPPTVMMSLPRSESGSMPRVSIVPELDEGSSGEDASSAKSLVVDQSGQAAAGKR
ncbi:hypothetical protein BCR44DRAFT_1524624 [Catenaria anguillulae PL171]|uniref:Uncharacterized protein n=1 Tax=Catenaria anguillulae PL171 TaxID=765915 RepID=A0A1Y2HR32_9FUNG|nr:hypothetical protein BCR44DRAFT_1524624 [Catenaria anguillulae PL171]